MTLDELQMYAPCVGCGQPCKKPLRVIYSTGDEGDMCKGCLRRNRKTCRAWPK